MRVVHITTSDMSLRFLLLDQFRYLREVGYEVSAVSAQGPWVDEVRASGFNVTTTTLTRRVTPREDLQSMGALIAHFRRIRPDIVHTHTPKATLLGQWAAFVARVPRRVHTIHGLYIPGHVRPRDRWRYVWLERIAMNPAHLVLSQSAEDLETCRRERICDPARLRFLGNGIDIDLFHPRNRPSLKARTRATLGIPEDQVVVGMVGRMTAEKGYRDYFAAAARVHTSDPDVTFLAIGPYEPTKRDAVSAEEAAAWGLGDHLRVLGHRNDMVDLYAAMDVLVLPSHREGFPRAPMEAAATGLPVIVTDERGGRATVLDGESGYLVPLRDPAVLADRISRLVRDSGMRERFGARGRELAQEQFDQRRVFARVADAYAELGGPRS
jgi:glycosyltransferase involved in cell wall biosynthesis